MKRSSAILIMVTSVTISWAVPALAQTTSNQPNSNSVGQQFNNGANGVGQGAAQIGQGIKNGAILTWEAIKSGVTSATAKFNGSGNVPSTDGTEKQ